MHARKHATATAPNSPAWENGGAYGRKRLACKHSRTPGAYGRKRLACKHSRTPCACNGTRARTTADRPGAAHARKK
eukprot:2050004-Pleurochrysis_carterae.AAC.1